MRVAMNELKAGLASYVARARAGEVIEITSHNKPVARMSGLPTADDSGIQRLVLRGAASWGGGKPALEPAVTLGDEGKSLSEIVLEDRR